MKVLFSWLREFVDVPGTAADVAARMSVRGFAVEGIDGAGDDAVIDFEVTANRPDCLSVLGLAREVATAYGLPLREPAEDAALATLIPAARTEVSVHLDDPDLGPRYAGAVADVTVGAVARLAAGASASRRRAPDQQRRRHHQLRAARARPADARLRPREDRRRRDPGARAPAPARGSRRSTARAARWRRTCSSLPTRPRRSRLPA